jgi:ATP-dependent DNA ligase
LNSKWTVRVVLAGVSRACFLVGGLIERTDGWSLLLGTLERRRLRSRGLVHWGVGRRLAEALTTNGLVRSTSPFSDRVPLRRVTWLEPTLVAEVSYANMTANGLRAPVFRELGNTRGLISPL